MNRAGSDHHLDWVKVIGLIGAICSIASLALYFLEPWLAAH